MTPEHPETVVSPHAERIDVCRQLAGVQKTLTDQKTPEDEVNALLEHRMELFGQLGLERGKDGQWYPRETVEENPFVDVPDEEPETDVDE